MSRHSLTLALAVSGVVLAAAASQAPCADAPPAGFKSFESLTWEGPWVVDARTSAPLTSFSTFDAPVPLRLDDGSRGAVRVTPKPCQKGQPCDVSDCGCLEYDRSLVEILDARGRLISSRHLWAAYSRITIVPVDLVGGAGDELIIVRIPARSAPPSGHELKIWRLDAAAPVDLVTDSVMLARNFGTTPISCARWQGVLSIDRSAPAPRTISIRHDLGSKGCCQIFPDDNQPSADELRRDRRLQFDPASGRYLDSLGRR